MVFGSANISSDYGGKFHGDSFFYDLNLYSENVNIEETYDFMGLVSDYHGVTLNKNYENNSEYIQYLKEKFKNSEF